MGAAPCPVEVMKKIITDMCCNEITVSILPNLKFLTTNFQTKFFSKKYFILARKKFLLPSICLFLKV